MLYCHNHLALATTAAAVLPLLAELEREIFETAAIRSPSLIPALLRVARRVHIWVEPFLYRVVSVTQRQPPLRAILDSDKPPKFFQRAVRHLAFPLLTDDDVVTRSDTERLFDLCSGIVSFGGMPIHGNGLLLRFLNNASVQRLALYVTHIFDNSPVDFSHRAFRSLTHLDMFESIDDKYLPLLPLIPTLPVLTHLGVDPGIPRDNILPVLAECPQLHLLISLWPSWQQDEYIVVKTASILDARFVIGMFDDYWAEWEAGARGMPDFWSRGDDFVARKRKGEIEAGRFWMD